MGARDEGGMRRAGTSVISKIRDTAKAQGLDGDFLLRKFGGERLLARLNESEHAGGYCVKGGTVMLVAAPGMPRSTEDLDITALASFEKEDLLRVFRAVAAVVPMDEDGMLFAVDEARAAKDGMQREEGVNPGFRMFLDGTILTIGRPVPFRVKLDAAHGEAITPGPVWGELSPTLRGWTPPRVPMYPVVTLLAEKIHAICKQGMDNSRLRDFYDIVAITREHAIGGGDASRALRATFATRGAPLADAEPDGLGAEFVRLRQGDWASLMGKRAFRVKLGPFPEVVGEVAAFARPLLAAAAAGESVDAVWEPGAGWAPAPAMAPAPF